MIGRVVLGRYRIVRALAKGGMGVVYLARSEGASGFAKPVVVKRMMSELMGEDTMTRMFVREARLMSMLRHPGIVGVMDFGEEGNAYLMVLDYIHGYHLGQWHRYLRKVYGSFPPYLACHAVIKVLEALHYAHELRGEDGEPLGIVHRDVSPSNVLVDVEGHVKLADFGIARSREHTEHTEENTIKGKMPYLAPELFRRGNPSGATDTYACAVVLHELLLGYNEFRGPDVATTVSRVLEQTPTRLDQARDDVPQDLADVIAVALGKDPIHRYQTAEELAQALRSVRNMSDDEANAEMRKLIRRDFLDPRMSEALEAPALPILEAAWKRPPGSATDTGRQRAITGEARPVEADGTQRAEVVGIPAVETVPAPAIDIAVDSFMPVHTAKTVVETSARFAEQPSPARGVVAAGTQPGGSTAGGRATIIAAGMVLAAAVIVGGAFVFFPPRQQQQRPTNIVVVPTPGGAEEPLLDAGAQADTVVQGFDAAMESEDAAVVAANDASTPRSGRDGGRRDPNPNRGNRGSALTSAFSAQRAAVMQCFRVHTMGLEGQPEVQIRFSLGPEGNVESAHLSPAPLEQTPLGNCLLGIARATQFPPGDPVTFAIPLAVRGG